MTEDYVVSLGVSRADPSVPWPARGSAEKALCERDGWERRLIPTVSRGLPSTVEAMCRGELAVHLMLGGDEGFAISLVSTGWRISYGGSVFGRCNDAMLAAERMMEASSDWTSVQVSDFTAAQREAMRVTIKAAEQRGEIMLDKVYPW